MSDSTENLGIVPFRLTCSTTDDAPLPAHSRFHALIEFLKAEQAEILRFLTQKVQCPSAAADLVQELYLRIVTLARPDRIRNPKGFLYTAAKHLAIDYLRQRDRARSRSEPLSEAMAVPTTAPDAETTVDAKKSLAVVLKAIDELPRRCRIAFIMFKFEHRTYEEIARELNISVKTVEHHLSKALAHCRMRFEAFDNPADTP